MRGPSPTRCPGRRKPPRTFEKLFLPNCKGTAQAVPRFLLHGRKGSTSTPERHEHKLAHQRLQVLCPESHAAAIKHALITSEKTIGRIKRYLQLTTVMAAKQSA